MKLARFRINGWESYGLVEGAEVRAIQGDIFREYSISEATYPLDRVKLLPPTQAASFWAVGLNYAAMSLTKKEHWTPKESAGRRGFSGPGRRASAASSAIPIPSCCPRRQIMSTTRANW